MPLKGRIVVNEMYCKGCELCVAACPQEVLALANDHITAKGYHPATLIAEGCTGCGDLRAGLPGSRHHRLPRESRVSNQRSAGGLTWQKN